MLYTYVVLMVQFSDRTYSGTEASGFVNVDVALIGGTSATPFGVTVTPSEQSPVSATGNNVICVLLCVD